MKLDTMHNALHTEKPLEKRFKNYFTVAKYISLPHKDTSNGFYC